MYVFIADLWSYWSSRSSHVTNQKIEILDDHFKSLHLNIEHKDHQAIVNWLSSSNFPAQQASLSSGRQEGTGSWLIESEEYKTWTECGGKTLICQGIPGAGPYFRVERDAPNGKFARGSLFARQNYACITSDR